MESETVIGKSDSNNTSLELSLTESQKDSTKPVQGTSLKNQGDLIGSKDSLDELENNREKYPEPATEEVIETQGQLSAVTSEGLTKIKEDFKGSRDSLDELGDGDSSDKELPVGSSIPLGLSPVVDTSKGFYLHPENSDSGSYTDSLEPDDNIPRVQLLPSKQTTSNEQPEADQEVVEVPEPKPRRKRRKSRLPVPKGMASLQKNTKSKDEKSKTEKDSQKEEQTKNDKETTKSCASKEDDTKKVTPNPTEDTSKNKKTDDVIDEADVKIADKPEVDVNSVASEKSSEKLSQNCDQGPSTYSDSKQEIHEDKHNHTSSTNVPKCQRSKSTDDPGTGSKDSSRSSINRRETIDMGETKACAARNLKETRMDLFMNSNEGFLIPHPPGGQAGQPPLRDTIASRLRIEKAHNEHIEPEKSPLDYLTPFQRKEHAIKDLKKQLKTLNKVLEDKDCEIAQLREGLGKEMQDLLNAKDEQIKNVQKQLSETESRYEELKRSYEESVKTVINLEATVNDLKESIAEQNHKNESLYLEMYLKGQDAARYEREEEIEQMAGKVNDKVFKKTSAVPDVNVKELLTKLKRTQEELAKWQSLRREEAYQEVETPETEAEATLRFLRDSFFHYITDFKGQDDHMRAMIQIFNFTDVQKKKITKALLEKKPGKKS